MLSLLFSKDVMSELFAKFLFSGWNPAYHAFGLLSSLQLQDISFMAIISGIVALATLIDKIISINRNIQSSKADEKRKQEEHDAEETRKNELHALALEHTDKINILIREGKLEEVLTLTQIENETN